MVTGLGNGPWSLCGRCTHLRGCLCGPGLPFGKQLLNSHPAEAPYMAPLVMHYELSQNSHWGWSSGKVCVLTVARQGFEIDCNDFFIFALASIAEIPTWIFYNRDRNDLYRNRMYRRLLLLH